MSDTRKQIAERLIKEATPYASCGNPQYINAQAVCEKGMSEYAAAVLEDEANEIEEMMCSCTWEPEFECPHSCRGCETAKRLRARAAQERER